MLTTIRESWSWTGLEPAEVVASNSFGNLIVRATDGRFWRICPELVSCEVVANNADEYQTLLGDAEFQVDWRMERLVEVAAAKVGPLCGNECYCVKLPSILGGTFEAGNLGMISRIELISAMGALAHQIEDLPNGAKVSIEIVP